MEKSLRELIVACSFAPIVSPSFLAATTRVRNMLAECLEAHEIKQVALALLTKVFSADSKDHEVVEITSLVMFFATKLLESETRSSELFSLRSPSEAINQINKLGASPASSDNPQVYAQNLFCFRREDCSPGSHLLFLQGANLRVKLIYSLYEVSKTLN